ncbi:MAG TPA: hypothetical protein VFR29_01635 [Steroidobacteraceae bacterium]|nr:hypothetical protein [Steroidobacteraceae bacterium]
MSTLNLSIVQHAGAGAAALVLLSGCMTARLEEDRNMTTAIASHEAVVLLAKPHVEGITAEDEFMDCVGAKMSRQRGIQVRPNDEFVDSMFPWLEPSTAPQRPEGVTRLLARDMVAARIAESGVRYLVWVDGATRKTDSGGSITCTVGPAGGGCIGFGWWEKESDYQATVWDIETAKTAGSVSTNVTGTSALVGVLVPLPFIARVQGTACDRLATQLGAFLKGEDPSVALEGS